MRQRKERQTLSEAPNDRLSARRVSDRLRKKILLFQIIALDSELSVAELISRAKEQQIELTISSAYRVLADFEKHGNVEDSEVRCLRIVSKVLQDSPEGEHLSAKQIHEKVVDLNIRLHKSTVYRVMERLQSVDLVTAIRSGRQNCYEWKRDAQRHGHLSCISCGKTIEFSQEAFDELAKQVCLRTGYEFMYIEFLLRSVCHGCGQHVI